MAGFCTNCGTPLPDGANVCGQCGTPVAGRTIPTANAATTASTAGLDGGKKNKLIGIGVVAIVVVIIAVFVLKAVLGGAGYKGALNRFFKAYQKSDVEATFKTTNIDIFEDYLGERREDAKEYYDDDEEEWEEWMDEDYLTDMVEDQMDNALDKFGSNIKITYEIRDEEKLSKGDINDINDYLEDDFDSKAKVTEGYNLKLRIRVEGSEDEDSTTVEDVIVLKIDGKWKVDCLCSDNLINVI